LSPDFPQCGRQWVPYLTLTTLLWYTEFRWRNLMDYTKNCLWCAGIFTSSVARKKYCNRHCKHMATKSRSRGGSGVKTRTRNLEPVVPNTAERRQRLRGAGYTLETFVQTKQAQGGHCAICRVTPEPKPGWSEGLVPDHKHATTPPQPRGLLCPHCNSLIGFALDRPEVCEAAAAYLRKWS